MGEVQLELGLPRVVAEERAGHCWFPGLRRFSGGELLLTHLLTPDSNENLHNSVAVYLSFDQGRRFDFAYDVNGFFNGGSGEPRISLADGRLVGGSTSLKPDPPGQWRRFVSHHWTFENRGRRYRVEPWAAHVEGLPRDVEPWPRPSRTWWARTNWFSEILMLPGGHFLSTLSLRYQGDARTSTVALVSEDEGRYWRYLSQIAGPEAVADAKEGFGEPCMVFLANGDLMCVSRVGAGADQKLARTYSSDGGKTWSAMDRLPAFSVAPHLCRLANGALLLVTGRPGLFLWVSTDGRGRRWDPVDLMAHHNSLVDPPFRMTARQTTAYQSMVEIEPNRVAIVYDRTPFGWRPVPADSGERSQIYLLEVGVELQA